MLTRSTFSTFTTLALIASIGLLQHCAGPDTRSETQPEGQSASFISATARDPIVAPLPLGEARREATRYLLETQMEDGSFGHFLPRRPADIYLGTLDSLHAFGNASTGLCLMALLRQEDSAEIRTALRKGFNFLANESVVNKRVNQDTFYNVWAHTYMIEALIEGLADERVANLHSAMKDRCKGEIERLLKLQALEGGFGYFDFNHHLDPPYGAQSTSFNTAAALIALHMAKEAGFKVPELAVERGLESLERMTLSTGAYMYSYSHYWASTRSRSSKVEGSLTRSPCANMARVLWGVDKGTERLQLGLSNLFQHHDYIEIARQRQYPHETWFANAPYYYYFGHYYASRNLDLLESSEDQASNARKLADFVLKTQDKDGSFWDYPLYGYTKAYATGYALICLSNCQRHIGRETPAIVTSKSSFAGGN